MMKTLAPIALAVAISASSVAGMAYAQTADMSAPNTIPANDGVSVVYLTPMSQSDHANMPVPDQFANPTEATTAAAQNEIQTDPQLLASLETRNVQLNNVVAIDTAANGGKIVYVR
jgi:hypothetical protein